MNFFHRIGYRIVGVVVLFILIGTYYSIMDNWATASTLLVIGLSILGGSLIIYFIESSGKKRFESKERATRVIQVQTEYKEHKRTDFTEKGIISLDPSKDDLRKANFEGLDLSKFNFTRSNLTGANLKRANCSSMDLTGVNFSQADVTEAIFERAVLKSATFRMSTIEKTNFSFANLHHTDFGGSVISNAVFTGAEIDYFFTGGTIFESVDFREINNGSVDIKSGIRFPEYGAIFINCDFRALPVNSFGSSLFIRSKLNGVKLSHQEQTTSIFETSFDYTLSDSKIVRTLKDRVAVEENIPMRYRVQGIYERILAQI